MVAQEFANQQHVGRRIGVPQDSLSRDIGAEGDERSQPAPTKKRRQTKSADDQDTDGLCDCCHHLADNERPHAECFDAKARVARLPTIIDENSTREMPLNCSSRSNSALGTAETPPTTIAAASTRVIGVSRGSLKKAASTGAARSSTQKIN